MYSNYCRHSLLCTKYFVCVRVCACYEISMSINIVQCSLHKLKKKANRLVTRIIKVSPLSLDRYSNIHNLQHFPLTKDLTLISCRDPTGVCHLVLSTFRYPRSHPRI